MPSMTQITSEDPVVDEIRHRVAQGVLPPGSWLRQSALAADLGVSRTPVREALRTLAAEGLLELVPNRGARVVSWSAEDVDETYRLRALLEGEAAALAARRASAEQVRALAGAQEAYERSLAGGAPLDERAGCNAAFHAAVVDASGSTRLRQLLAVISSPPMVARALGTYGEQDVQRSVVQHRDILTAVERRDEPLAAAAMRSHLLAARYVAMRAVEVR